MVRKKTQIAIVIIVIIALVAGYGLGQFSTQEEQLTYTTTSITTITKTTTSTTTLTETSVSTKTILRDIPSSQPSPENSISVLRERLVLNNSVFLTISTDKSIYSQGESMIINSTVTNLESNNVQLDIDVNILWVYNSTGNLVWTFDESFFNRNFLGPPLNDLWISLGPYCSAGIVSLWEHRQPNSPEGSCNYSINESIVKWNITGLHTVSDQISNIFRTQIFYDNHYLPEGQYILTWEPTLRINNQKETIRETIPFSITKQD